MYTAQAHPCRFTHSLRLEQLPARFQEFAHEWARNLDPQERLQYCDGEFYMVVPFEMLTADPMALSDLVAFTRRFNRLHEVRNDAELEAHMAKYPFQGWPVHGENFEDYMEMMFMLHHLKSRLDPDLAKPATLAIFFHD